MADYTALTIATPDIDGIADLVAAQVAVTTQDTDGFEVINDGRTILLVDDTGGDADVITFEGVADQYGRNESPLTRAIGAGKVVLLGPFSPHLWNQDGYLRFKFTTSPDANTKIVAIRVANPG